MAGGLVILQDYLSQFHEEDASYSGNKETNSPAVKKDVNEMEEVTAIITIVKHTAAPRAASSLSTWVEIAVNILESPTRMYHFKGCRTTRATASIIAATGCLSQFHEEVPVVKKHKIKE
jgi:hypothetical protein